MKYIGALLAFGDRGRLSSKLYPTWPQASSSLCSHSSPCCLTSLAIPVCYRISFLPGSWGSADTPSMLWCCGHFISDVRYPRGEITLFISEFFSPSLSHTHIHDPLFNCCFPFLAIPYILICAFGKSSHWFINVLVN